MSTTQLPNLASRVDFICKCPISIFSFTSRELNTMSSCFLIFFSMLPKWVYNQNTLLMLKIFFYLSMVLDQKEYSRTVLFNKENKITFIPFFPIFLIVLIIVVMQKIIEVTIRIWYCTYAIQWKQVRLILFWNAEIKRCSSTPHGLCPYFAMVLFQHEFYYCKVTSWSVTMLLIFGKQSK